MLDIAQLAYFNMLSFIKGVPGRGRMVGEEVPEFRPALHTKELFTDAINTAKIVCICLVLTLN